MKLSFVRSEAVVSDVRTFIFEPEESISWLPGQYIHYKLPHPDADERGTERWFTNSAAPFENHVAISTRINSEQGSSFKRALMALQPGDLIEADAPQGDFTIGDPDRNYIFIAGGIGITPFRSILFDAYNKGLKLKVNLLYATRSNDIPFKDELNLFATNNPNLKIEYIIDPASIDTDLMKSRIEAVEDPLVYISGPKPMVKNFARQLREMGLDKSNIKKDDFPGYKAY